MKAAPAELGGLSYALAEEFTEQDRVTGKRVVNMQNREQQIAQGKQYGEQAKKEWRAQGIAYNEAFDPEAYQRIVRIFNRLHGVSHLREEAWQPYLVDIDKWNAFTFGGANFFVLSGLEKDLKSDDELAAVIAHEMAHTVAGHIGEKTAYRTLSLVAGSRSSQRGTFQQAFTHTHEEEADKIGILYCALAGFDPYAATHLWRHQYEQHGTQALLFQDHPMNAERAQLTQAVADQVFEYYQPGITQENFASILKENNLWTTEAPQQSQPGTGGGLVAVINGVAEAYNAKAEAQREELRQQQRIAFVRNVANYSSIVLSRPVAEHTWRVGIQYRGIQPLSEVAWRGIFKGPRGQRVEIISQYRHPIRYGQTYLVDFTSPQLLARYQHPQKIKIGIDNAL